MTFKTGGVIDSINTFIIGEIATPSECPRDINIGRTPAAYIVTDSRGKRYLVFAGSTEYDNAVMFNYEIKPLYE